MAFYLVGVVFRTDRMLLAGSITAFGTLVIQAIGILLRWWESYRIGYGHARFRIFMNHKSCRLVYQVCFMLFWNFGANKGFRRFSLLFAFLAMACVFFRPIDSNDPTPVPAL
jgi:hypothetical protein